MNFDDWELLPIRQDKLATCDDVVVRVNGESLCTGHDDVARQEESACAPLGILLQFDPADVLVGWQ